LSALTLFDTSEAAPRAGLGDLGLFRAAAAGSRVFLWHMYLHRT